MVVVVVVVVVAVVLVDQALNMAELVDMARDGERAVMVETVLFLGSLQELLEEWVGHVHHRDHKPLLLLSLTNHDCQASLWNISELLVSRMTKVEIHELLLSNNPHGKPQKYQKENKSLSFTFTRKGKRKAKDQMQKWQA
ncbi:hypothetical protein V6N13_030648 [Hibiscus sabdariffa]|uniref:Uncharacterized protein n=1 Tax=Hibiscus sabdariffa TaxID=183260 RepID=A0ABR2D5W4_9ROSI